MKRAFSILFSLLLLILALPALSEGIVAFEKLSYNVNINTTLNIKPVVQNIKGNLIFDYTSSDESIVTVKDGFVRGISSGTATITCTVTEQDGTTHTISCAVSVVVPIESISADVKKLAFPYHPENAEDPTVLEYTYTPTLTIKPENATNKTLSWSSSNEDVAKVDENGQISGNMYGKAVITGKATDGSGKVVKINVSNPAVVFSPAKLTISSPEGAIITQFTNGTAYGIYETALTGNCFDMESVGDSFSHEDKLKITPIKAGSGKILIYRNGSVAGSINIKIEHSAVYDTVSYPPMSAAKILSDSQPYTNFQIVATIESIEDQSVLAYVENNDKKTYLSFTFDPSEKIEVGETYKLYSKLISVNSRTSETGLSYDCINVDVPRIEVVKR